MFGLVSVTVVETLFERHAGSISIDPSHIIGFHPSTDGYGHTQLVLSAPAIRDGTRDLHIGQSPERLLQDLLTIRCGRTWLRVGDTVVNRDHVVSASEQSGTTTVMLDVSLTLHSSGRLVSAPSGEVELLGQLAPSEWTRVRWTGVRALCRTPGAGYLNRVGAATRWWGTLPSLSDPGGYQLTERELALSGVTASEVRLALSQRKPLGFPSIRLWSDFQEDLQATVSQIGVSDVQARLGGTSRCFFSSPWSSHRFPASEADYVNALHTAPHHRERAPAEREAAAARHLDVFRQHGYHSPGPRPTHHFWDSRYLLGLSQDPCDYDIELNSPELNAAMEAEAASTSLALPAAGKVWAETALLRRVPVLVRFKTEWSQTLGRPVDFELLGPDGPERLALRTAPGDPVRHWWTLMGLE